MFIAWTKEDLPASNPTMYTSRQQVKDISRVARWETHPLTPSSPRNETVDGSKKPLHLTFTGQTIALHPFSSVLAPKLAYQSFFLSSQGAVSSTNYLISRLGYPNQASDCFLWNDKSSSRVYLYIPIINSDKLLSAHSSNYFFLIHFFKEWPKLSG